MEIDQITYKIIGASMNVYKKIGNGFQEVIYQRCLAVELEKTGLKFVREFDKTIYYNNIDVGTRRVDFIVEDLVIIELKALLQLEDVHLAQAKNYLVVYKFDIGLLLNFCATKLEYKKIFHPKKV